MAVGFYFTSPSGTLQLPVNPPELTIRHRGNNQRTEVVKLGEINILRDAKLSELSFRCLLPGDDYYPFITGHWRPPAEIARYFRGAMDGQHTLRLAISDFNINMRLSVEDVSEQRVAGDHDSVLCTLTFLEYRGHGARTLVIPATAAATPSVAPAPRPSDKPQVGSYTIRPGDTLWAIAQRELGNGSRHPEIARLNSIANPNLIFPGVTIKLPPR